MKTKTTLQRLALALIGTATVLGASACGATQGGAGSSTGSPTAPTAPASASMDAGMGASPMASSMGTTMGTSSGTTATADLTIHIKSFSYTGPDSVPAGSKVTVMNMDSQAHTLTADDGSFDAVVKPGTSVTFTAPAKPGSYTYHCTYHSNMHGTLTVK